MPTRWMVSQLMYDDNPKKLFLLFLKEIGAEMISGLLLFEGPFDNSTLTRPGGPGGVGQSRAR
jgi:hypothetical protein